MSDSGSLRNIYQRRPEAAEESPEARRERARGERTSYWLLRIRAVRVSANNPPQSSVSFESVTPLRSPATLSPRKPNSNHPVSLPFDSWQSRCQEYAGNSSIMSIITANTVILPRRV